MENEEPKSSSSIHIRNIANDLSSDEEEPFSDDDEEEEEEELENMESVDKELRTMNTVQIDKAVTEINQKIAHSSQKRTNINNPIKVLVSKQKRRFKLDGFNLDLTYVTERIIAMGFPAENYESIYRNSMTDVIKFFNTRHNNHYKIYNLCAERKYKVSNFYKVSEYPFEDHQAPTFELIFKCCEDLDEWLKSDERNVAGIHCKAGKGRTGVMICCYLLYSKQFLSSYDALKYYGLIRTKNKKGVTIPSQIRYVHYFEKALSLNWSIKNLPLPEVELTKIRLSTIPNFNIFGGCEPWFLITSSNSSNENEVLFSSKQKFKIKSYKSEAFIEYELSGIVLRGDVLVEFYNNSLLKKKEKMFQVWFNCGFFDQNGMMVIDKFMLDKACKVFLNDLNYDFCLKIKDKSHKKFNKDFNIEFHARYKDEKHEKLKNGAKRISNNELSIPNKFFF